MIRKQDGLLLNTRYKGRVIASALWVHFNNQALLKYSVSDKQYQNVRPNDLLMWSGIKMYCQQGYKSMSFGRSEPTHYGLRKFKSSWGAREKALNYYRHNISKKNSYTLAPVNVEGWPNDIMKRMPISLLKRLGSLIYKHMG